MNFEAAALAAITPGQRGIVACPVKAHWGPMGEFVTITRESGLINTFTTDDTDGATAYNTVRFALMGGARQVLAYRLGDGNEARSSIILADTTSPSTINILQLDAKYPGVRGNNFRITVRENPVDVSKKDILLYEGTVLLRQFIFAGDDIDEAVAAINNDSGNYWIAATKLAEGNGILGNATASPMAGGDSGISGIVTQQYIDAMDKFEAQEFHGFCLDGISDGAIQTSVKSWIERVRSEGKYIISALGGSATNDKDASIAITRGATWNHEGVINVGVGGYLDGVEYSSAQLACWVIGLITGQKLKESTTYASAPFSDVNRRWTRPEQEEAKKNGVFLLIHDGRMVKVLSGINSLISLRQDQNNQWKKVRAIRTMDAIASDLQATAEASYIGKVNNDAEGRQALIDACKRYMETMAKGGVIEGEGWDVYLDPDYYGLNATLDPEPDEVFVKYEAYLTDVMEKIFGTFYVL